MYKIMGDDKRVLRMSVTVVQSMLLHSFLVPLLAVSWVANQQVSNLISCRVQLFIFMKF